MVSVIPLQSKQEILWRATFFWYDTDRIENYASYDSSLPRERLYGIFT
jgi:hypothetical protein